MCSPWARIHPIAPPSPICLIRKREPFNHIFPTSLSKSAHAWQNTKEQFTAGLEGKRSSPHTRLTAEATPPQPLFAGPPPRSAQGKAWQARSQMQSVFCKVHQVCSLLPQNTVATQRFMSIKKWKVLMLSLQAAGNLRPLSHWWKREQESPFREAAMYSLVSRYWYWVLPPPCLICCVNLDKKWST